MAATEAPSALRDVREARWVARPAVAALLRCGVVLVPLLVGVTCGVVAARLTAGLGLGIVRLFIVLGASTAAIVVTEKVARRCLPLAMLLRFSLVFPDRAPSRVRIALRSGNLRRLRRWAEVEHEQVPEADAAGAAERVLSLVTALGAHDRRTRGHSERVRALAEVLGEEMGLDSHARDRLRWAALLHDIGKLQVPSAILNKPGKPTADEWATLQQHPAAGIELVGPLAEWLGEWAHGIDEHHERWDGKGYPYGRAGTDISRAGRIIAVADAFECMTEVRSYQRPRSYAEARVEVTRCAGSQFDPEVVRSLQAMSLARLHWTMGPLSWVMQIPFLGAAPRTAVELANVTSAAAVSTVAQVTAAAVLLTAPVPAAALKGVESSLVSTTTSRASTSDRPGSGTAGRGADGEQDGPADGANRDGDASTAERPSLAAHVGSTSGDAESKTSNRPDPAARRPELAMRTTPGPAAPPAASRGTPPVDVGKPPAGPPGAPPKGPPVTPPSAPPGAPPTAPPAGPPVTPPGGPPATPPHGPPSDHGH